MRRIAETPFANFFLHLTRTHTRDARLGRVCGSLLATMYVRAACVLSALPLTTLAGNRRFREPAKTGGQKDASWENEAGFFAMFCLTPNTWELRQTVAAKA